MVRRVGFYLSVIFSEICCFPKKFSLIFLGFFFCNLGGDISQLPQLLLSVCETVKDEALALIDNTRHMRQSANTAEDEDSMETDSPRGSQKDQKDGVSGGRSDERCFLISRSQKVSVTFKPVAQISHSSSVFHNVQSFLCYGEPGEKI